MPSFSLPSRVPSYRRHKPTGQAVVTLNGKDIYLGKWNTSASKAEYNRLIGEWLVGGRSLPRSLENDLTVAELLIRYWRFAKGYYVKNGRPTSWQVHIRLVIRILKKTYGHTRAADFGPLAMKAYRQGLIDAGQSRKYINKLTAIIPRMFKWGVAEELIPSSVYESLRTVEGLRKGRTTAHETIPVLPVADAVVDATLPHLPLIIADMIRFQRLTGCRPGEVCILRPCDVDLTGEVWAFRPESHKTQHHGRHRVIFLGPKAQDVLRPYLLREKTDYCFAPAESEQKRHARQREDRKSPMTPSQAKRRPKRHPKRLPGNRYATASYRRAITRAVDLANRQIKKEAAKMGIDHPALLPNWHPNQLRHSVGTEVRKQFGLEATQVVLGHASANVSEIYAERDMTLAAEIMRKIG
jgi:integrase